MLSLFLTIQTEFDSAVGDAVIACAKQQIGKPYVTGAAGPNSFDATGLVQFCYKKAGKSIPRTMNDICRSGKEVKLVDVKPGDIMCLQSSTTSHVVLHAGVSGFLEVVIGCHAQDKKVTQKTIDIDVKMIKTIRHYD